MSGHTPGPWRYEAGGGHAHNSIRGSDSVQTNGWLEPRGGVRNASYSDMVCENFGNAELPGPAANIRLIVAAPDLLEALQRLLPLLDHDIGGSQGSALQQAIAAVAKATQP